MSEVKTMATIKGTPLPWTTENTKLVRDEKTGQFVCDLSDDDIQTEEIWQHFDRMQQRVMADKTTREEFFEQTDDERMEFYNWLRNQCGEYADYI